MRILLVEDNPGDVRLAEEAFKECKMPVHLTVMRDGDQAIKYLNKQDGHTYDQLPDLVILDLNLPKLNGVQVLELIKTSDAQTFACGHFDYKLSSKGRECYL